MASAPDTGGAPSIRANRTRSPDASTTATETRDPQRACVLTRARDRQLGAASVYVELVHGHVALAISCASGIAVSAVYGECYAGNEGRVIRGKKRHRGGNVLGLSRVAERCPSRKRA